jgi:hypothetical protein
VLRLKRQGVAGGVPVHQVEDVEQELGRFTIAAGAEGGGYLGRMPRSSRTNRHLRDRHRLEGVRAIPAGTFDDPTFIPRLSFKLTEPSPANPGDWDRMATIIANAGDVAFFCDNSLFADSTPAEIWPALLGRPGRLVLTTGVRAELEPWLARRPSHPVKQALDLEETPIATYEAPGSTGQVAFDYYVGLLHLRRRPLVRALEDFRKDRGREPTPDERAAIMGRIQTYFGQRGALLAKKGSSSRTDEELVYLAVEHALTTGRQSAIVTVDADVSEQFYKLMWLVDTHYRSMLLGDRYAIESLSLRPRPLLNPGVAVEAWPFETAVAIDRPGDVLMRALLPDRFRFVAVSCDTVGEYFSHLAFGAECEMARLLRVKERTDGLSTDRLGARNVHAWLGPLPIAEEFRACGAVTTDRRIKLAGRSASVAHLDWLHALGDFETHGEFEEVAQTPVLTELTKRARRSRP